MIFKIVKEYLRRIRNKFKSYILSIIGLGIVIMLSFHIFHFVIKEFSYNTFHSNKKSVYRVVKYNTHANYGYSKTAIPFGAFLKDKLSEVQDYVRIIKSSGSNYKVNNSSFKGHALYTDPSFFKVFDFKLTRGNVLDFENKPNSVIVSEKLAKIIFKNSNPIGELIDFSNSSQIDNKVLEVVGIMKNIPSNSTIQSDFMINIAQNRFVSESKGLQKWQYHLSELYLYLPHLKDLSDFQNKLNKSYINEVNPKKPKEFKEKHNYTLQNISDIYLHSNDIRNQQFKGSLEFLNLLIIVGLLLISIAISNFILMNISLNYTRIKEFKIQFHLGSSKLNLWKQLFVESIITSMICLVITLISNSFFENQITTWLGSHNNFSIINDISILGLFTLLIIILAIIISIFEFLYFKKLVYNSKHIDSVQTHQKQIFFKVLTGIQLFLFITSFSFVILVNKQLNFIKNFNLGYNYENIVSIYGGRNESLINELKSKSFVEKIARGGHLFGTIVRYQDITIVESQTKVQSRYISGDDNYIECHGMELIMGENIKSPLVKKGYPPGDLKHVGEVIVSENFVKKSGLIDPIGKHLSDGRFDNEIIGVFKNVEHESLYKSSSPIIIGASFGLFDHLQIKSVKNRKSELIHFLEEYLVSTGTDPLDVNGHIIVYEFKNIYAKELNFQKVINVYMIAIVLISILGLIGMILFITESKTKEIGIRKVNGATIKEIMLMLNKDFIKWVVIAFIIACPIAYYAMSKWLENFAYKTPLSWWVFALAGVFTLIIALLTVSWQSYRAATRNPVESLRDE